MTEDDRTKEIALAEYKEVVTQFRTLTDIRFKLLTYLPLGTVAAAVFVPAANDLVKQPAIPAFAFVVTLCIATFRLSYDQHYDELVSRAAELERELQIERGSFSNRPKPWLKYGFVPVEHRWPIGVIYAAAASLCAYLCTAALVQDQPGLIMVEVYCAGRGDCVLARIALDGERSRREAAKGRQAFDGTTTRVEWRRLARQTIAAQPILGIEEDVAKRRVAYHWKGYEQKRDSRAASALLSAVIDLPSRWIEDVWNGRR